MRPSYSISSKFVIIFALFLISPFVGFLGALTLPASRSKSLIICLYTFVIGCSFLLTEPEVDSYRHANDFVNICKYGIYTVVLQMDKSFYDIYAVVVKILVSKFSHNPKILFGIYGAIWGYFAYKSLFFISKISKDRNKIFIILMLGLCFICNSHININGVRFGTASWVFLASYFGELLNYKGWKYVKYLTPFIHLTFVLPIIIYHIAKIIKNKYNICYIILISSFVLSIIASYSVGAKLFTLFPEDFHFSTYVSQDYVQDYSDNAADRSILTEIFSMIPKIVMLLYLIKSYGNIKFYSVNKNDRFRSTYLFESIHMLLMASFLYLCKLIPDASRFAYIVYPLFIAYILRTKGEPYTKITSRTIIIILYLAFVGSIYKELFWHNYVLNNNYIFSNLYTIISDCSSFVFR